MMFYTGNQFPAKYKNGAFIVFHGSWNRAPFAMDGFNVRFVPFKGETVSGDSEVFASGFAGPNPVTAPNNAAFRPVGIAQAADGSIYISEDAHGRIWRVRYTGGK
jgi:glucose/arabinose dehydrogenase